MFARFSPYLLWFALSLPALGMVPALLGSDPEAFHHLLHPSGEFAARFLIVSMLATPLMILFKGWRGPRWLKANRRYFGVAAFAYSALHVWVYVVGKASFDRILADATHFDIWTGWLAFAIFIPLAATSMDFAVRKLGTSWKPLQRWVYAAAVLTALHWASVHNWGGWIPAATQFGPLVALSLYRLWWVYLRPRPVGMA
jgi:methionine sulfoxide reductase heme-binding subunit